MKAIFSALLLGALISLPALSQDAWPTKPVSLVVPYQIASMRSRPVEHLQPGTLVRFSIGLEEVEDLRRDLQQAMDRAFGTA